ncbi:DUF2520 domain-containing protein [Polaribacter sp.]|nr:DUF2520 domain-containing protein [Polaribacter sp.]
MISVLIVGNGNVAFHFFEAFSKIESLEVYRINSRNLIEVPVADITIIAVSDNAITEVSKKITNQLVVHTSGFSSINFLENTTRKGVFYPLQSFSKEKKLDFSEIPICIEAQHKNDEILLRSLAEKLSKKVYIINSEQRKAIHVSAVFVNNFSNHMYKIGNDICKRNNIPFEILMPLIQETAKKITKLSPLEAQTGPAVRNDSKTMDNHLFLLNEKEKEIYKLITTSIQNGN